MDNTTDQLLQMVKDQAPDALRQYVEFERIGCFEAACISLALVMISALIFGIAYVKRLSWETDEDGYESEREMATVVRVAVMVIAGFIIVTNLGVIADSVFTLWQIEAAPKGMVLYHIISK